MQKKVKKDYTPKFFPKKSKILVAPKVNPEKKRIAGVDYYERINPMVDTQRYIACATYERMWGSPKRRAMPKENKKYKGDAIQAKQQKI